MGFFELIVQLNSVAMFKSSSVQQSEAGVQLSLLVLMEQPTERLAAMFSATCSVARFVLDADDQTV